MLTSCRRRHLDPAAGARVAPDVLSTHQALMLQEYVCRHAQLSGMWRVGFFVWSELGRDWRASRAARAASRFGALSSVRQEGSGVECLTWQRSACATLFGGRPSWPTPCCLISEVRACSLPTCDKAGIALRAICRYKYRTLSYATLKISNSATRYGRSDFLGPRITAMRVLVFLLSGTIRFVFPVVYLRFAPTRAVLRSAPARNFLVASHLSRRIRSFHQEFAFHGEFGVNVFSRPKLSDLQKLPLILRAGPDSGSGA
jgi:hypothetical protein